MYSQCPPAFERCFPALGLPWVRLGSWPTPVARLRRLGAALGVDLWIKRDDVSGERYGGNKVRKLEPLLAAALTRGRRTVVTVGGVGSNHMVATGLYSRELGLQTRAVLVRQPVTRAVQKNIALARSLDVELIPCPARALVPAYVAATAVRSDRPYLIGPGGSSPLGTLGYVAAGLELGGQVERGELPEPDEILVALGSGGTMAGLALGCALAGLNSRVVGVRVVGRALINVTLVNLLVSRTRRLLRRAGHVTRSTPLNMTVLHDFYGGEYGRPTTAADRAVELARDAEGLELETTYTGKALAALVESRRAEASRVLFWNTFNSRDTEPLLTGASELAPLPPPIRRWLSPTDR